MIIRSLRNIAEKYHNNNNMLSIISADETPHMTFETNGNGVVKISDDFPKRMVLNAKIMPVQNFSKAKLERKINGKTISYCDLYSHYENKYCSSVEVVFENAVIPINGNSPATYPLASLSCIPVAFVSGVTFHFSSTLFPTLKLYIESNFTFSFSLPNT